MWCDEAFSNAHTERNSESNREGIEKMNNEQRMVQAWHKRFGVAVNSSPTVISHDLFQLRTDLIYEEFLEFIRAGKEQDLVKIYGAAVTYGIDMQPIFAEVQRSNMSKGDPEVLKRPDGKVLKGKNWSPPNLAPILATQQRVQ